MLTPGRGSATPTEFTSLVTSPITIQSPYANNTSNRPQKRLTEIKEATPTPTRSGPASDLPPAPHDACPRDMQTAPPGGEKWEWHGNREKGGRRERKTWTVAHSPSRTSHEGRGTSRRSLQTDLRGGGGVSRDDCSEPEDRFLVSSPAPPISNRGSPLLRRRLSRDELISPAPSDASIGGRRSDVGGMGSPRHSAGTVSIRSSGSAEGVVKSEKSPVPEVVVDDASESSLSTSSFDVSIQLLDTTSPPHLILKAMESSE